jgi:hypothetical protein
MKTKNLILLAMLIMMSSILLAQKKQLRHVVLFGFKTTSSAVDVKKIENAFIALPKK